MSNAPEGTKLLYTLDEAGQALGVSGRTVRRMIADRQLHGVNVRGRLRVHPDDLVAYTNGLRDGLVDQMKTGSSRRARRSQ